jgi:glutamate dehydrogenase/leucine dehydrogenase
MIAVRCGDSRRAEGSIDREVARHLAAPVIVEAANGPTTAEADASTSAGSS